MSKFASGDTLVPSVLAVLLLDSEGNRIIAKYYQGFLGTGLEKVCDTDYGISIGLKPRS
jgi:hypothetical protein